MSRKIAVICLLLGMVAFVAAPAFAEVQNIKVSGDIKSMAVYRNNYDLDDDRLQTIDDAVTQQDLRRSDDQDSFFQSNVRLRVDADLTDNVSAAVQLANLREWDVDTAITNDINLDLAYVTLKEMLYSPLTLTIGRQNLRFGRQLIIGDGLNRDPDGSIAYNDLSPLHGYDAIRANLDYDPFILDLVIVKMSEGDDALNLPWVAGIQGADRDSDIDLYGINLGWSTADYDTELEVYGWFLRDATYALAVTGAAPEDRTYDRSEVITLGARGSFVPMENLTIGGEIAGQLGEIEDNNTLRGAADVRDREAMLGNVYGEYTLADVRLTPVLGAEYLYTSGEENSFSGDFEAWDPMYRGYVMGDIRDYLEVTQWTRDPSDTSGLTNQHTVKGTLALDLGEFVDGLSTDMAFLAYWFDENPSLNDADTFIGTELNFHTTYDYTEDVQFGLDTAMFMPQDYYEDEDQPATSLYQAGNMNMGADAANGRLSHDMAVSVIGSCTVTF